jgi:GTP-binding protein HflX
MTAQESLRELARLVRTAGALVVGQTLQRRPHPDPATYVGSGKLDEVREARERTGYTLVVFDEQLSPAQQLRLESALEVKVLDRSALILDIFASRARTREASLQVDLAQHEYLLPRLRGQWQHLERMEGAVGLRGPGETQLETDRRLIGERVRVLTKRLEKIRQQRETGRAARAGIPVPSIALVGYTNAGKSTLFRSVTGADAYVADQLFATLDPTVRRIKLPGGTAAVVADTVGFIRELPHELVAAFQSTLTEAREATLLLHVVDASDPRRDDHITQVNGVLAEVGAGELPQVLVYNKIDRLDFERGGQPPRIERDPEGRAVAVWISAAKRLGLDLLQQAISERISRVARRARLRLPASAGALRARLYSAGAVRTETACDDGSLDLTVELPDVELVLLARTPGVHIMETPSAAIACAPEEAYLQSVPS